MAEPSSAGLHRITVVRDAKRDELERRRETAQRRYELAIAEANLANLGTPGFEHAMDEVRKALHELDEIEAEREP